jgi:hypothetical protein
MTDDGFFPIVLPKPFRLVVTGDREWRDGHFVYMVLQAIGPERIAMLIHGCARGLDTLAGQAADRLHIDVYEFPVSGDGWKQGPHAGNLRNQQMIDEARPHVWLGFHDDFAHARGTKDMVQRCRAANLPGKLLSHTDRKLPAWLTD